MNGRESAGVVKALVLSAITIKEGRKSSANAYLALELVLCYFVCFYFLFFEFIMLVKLLVEFYRCLLPLLQLHLGNEIHVSFLYIWAFIDAMPSNWRCIFQSMMGSTYAFLCNFNQYYKYGDYPATRYLSLSSKTEDVTRASEIKRMGK